ncbi:MAG: response regulator, partial [Bacteroidales bacterium]|nr:response regulator [Bacteroidales bacterium]
IEERESLEKIIIKFEETSESLSRDIRVRINNTDANGQRHIRMTMQKFVFAGPNMIAGTMDDITDFKQTEKELIKSRSRLEKADRFKSIFLANLSYEIRTPMNAILGYSELLNQAGLSRKEISDYTSVIRSNGNYLLALIDDAIELSRFESGNIGFSYSEFKLLPLLQDLYNEFNNRRIEKGKTNIELVLDVPSDANDYVIYTDYGRLHQSLSNLLSNALKFTEKGKVVFGYKLSTKNVKFFVSDTGIGLSKEDERKIFNRFEVIEDTSVRKLSGTGLSLTISKHIIEQLGGKIKVKSTLNEGSRFQLSLPAISPVKKKQNSLVEDTEDSLHYNWKDKLILIVEDEDINYKFLEAVLQKTQVQILRARNGQEAVELCRKISQIDLVLMDIKLPVMSGYEAAVEIKKIRRDLPIIAQTAFSGQDEILKCQRAGCEDYLIKPIDINILVKKINEQFLR